MREFLEKLKKDVEIDQTEELPQEVTFKEACSLIQGYLAERNDEHLLNLFREGTGGNKDALEKSIAAIQDILKEKMIIITDLPSDEWAETIYRKQWGFDEIHDLYYDDNVDEIRINPNGRVFVSRKGKNERTDIVIPPEKVITLVERLIPPGESGQTSSLNESSPRLELVRPDRVRVSGLCHPLTANHGIALRKNANIAIEKETLINLNTMDECTWKLLCLLTRSRRNILISGGVNSGKTTLLQLLIGQFPENLSIRILDLDNEIRASELYPERDIWEMEAHPEVGVGMKELFKAILRLTPDVIIVGEFRGLGEAQEAVNAGTRGHYGMATAHFSSPEDAIEGTAMMMLQEGISLKIEEAMARVGKSFQFIVQMKADTTIGVKKIISITEVIVKNRQINYRPILEWVPDTEEYFGPGKWILQRKPSKEALEQMQIYVSEAEIDSVFRGVDD